MAFMSGPVIKSSGKFHTAPKF